MSESVAATGSSVEILASDAGSSWELNTIVPRSALDGDSTPCHVLVEPGGTLAALVRDGTLRVERRARA